MRLGRSGSGSIRSRESAFRQSWAAPRSASYRSLPCTAGESYRSLRPFCVRAGCVDAGHGLDYSICHGYSFMRIITHA